MWNSQKRQSEIIEAFEAANLNTELLKTEKPGQAIELAEKTTQEGADIIIPVGVDGENKGPVL